MPPNQPATPTHSFRCPDPIWDAAEQRAGRENKTMTNVIVRLLDLYGRGFVDDF